MNHAIQAKRTQCTWSILRSYWNKRVITEVRPHRNFHDIEEAFIDYSKSKQKKTKLLLKCPKLCFVKKIKPLKCKGPQTSSDCE